MNVKALRKLIQWIKAEPRRFDMHQWAANEDRVDELKPPCGTVGCLAGMACHMNGYKLLHADPKMGDAQGASKAGHHRRVQPLAMRLLGLDDDQANRLFFLQQLHSADNYWPEKYERQYFAAKTQRGRVGAAVRRIEHFIKTNGAE